MLTGIAFFAALLFAQPAQPLIERWIAAAGGRDVWDRVHTIQFTITTIWYDTTGAEIRRRPRHVFVRKDPGSYRVRVERREADGEYVQVLDGAASWATRDGLLLADSTRVVREVQYVAGDLTYWIALPWKLRDPGVRLSSPEPNVVHVTFGDGIGLHAGDRYWYYFTDDSPFPHETAYIEEGRTQRERIIWQAWKRIGPAVYSARRERVDAAGRRQVGFEIEDVVINRKLGDALFRRPAR